MTEKLHFQQLLSAMSQFTVEETRSMLQKFGFMAYKNWRNKNDKMKTLCFKTIALSMPRFKTTDVQRRLDYLRKIYLSLKTSQSDAIKWEFYVDMDEIFNRLQESENVNESLSFVDQQEEIDARALLLEMRDNLACTAHNIVQTTKKLQVIAAVVETYSAAEQAENKKLLEAYLANAEQIRRLDNESFMLSLQNSSILQQLIAKAK